MNVYVIVGEAPLYENTFLILKDRKVIVVDPGVSGKRILSACADLGGEPIAVLLTHGHADHILGAKELQEAGIPVYSHAEEFDVIASRANLALVLGRKIPVFTPDHAVRDGDELTLSPFTVKVIFTPGHTKGSVCYLIEGVLFSGDTLFAGSYGRADFPTGDLQDLVCSIANELFELPAETPVYCGHGSEFPVAVGDATLAFPDTTIGREYSTNPILDLL